jgi:hypothetical protein
MAACNDDCESVDLTSPIWFKVFQLGLINGTWADPFWAQEYLFQGAPFSVTIPEQLKPGRYLIRHEIIYILNSPQYFIECAQIEVSGNGTELPDPASLVSFPGAYQDTGKYTRKRK